MQTFLVNYSMPKIFQWGNKLSDLIPNYQKIFPLPTTIFLLNKLLERSWLKSTIEYWECKHKKCPKGPFVSIACLPAEFKTTFMPWNCAPCQNTEKPSCWISISGILTNTSGVGLHEPVAMAGHQKNSNGMLVFFISFMHEGMPFVTVSGCLLVGTATTQMLPCFLAAATSESHRERILMQG